jgi:hypothetical protein
VCYLTKTSRAKIMQCNFGDRWIKDHEILLEWYWVGRTEVLGKNLPHCHLVHLKSRMDWPGIEPTPWQLGLWLTVWAMARFIQFLGACSQYCEMRLAASCLSVSLSVHKEQLGSHRTDFHEIWYSEGLTVHLYNKVVLIFQQDVTLWSSRSALLWYCTCFGLNAHHQELQKELQFVCYYIVLVVFVFSMWIQPNPHGKHKYHQREKTPEDTTDGRTTK